jgi:UDP-4-amino-4,6-dideoxy-N-acetyl-beta-L-altrosamine N-acetyltransferase
MISMSEVLSGDRVTLRRMRTDDASLVVRWRNRPEVLSQMFNSVPPTLVSHERWFEAMQSRGDRHEFIIIERRQGDPIGTVGLSSIDSVNGRAEYGGLIGEPAARGRGYAYEASSLLLDYAFKTIELNRVYLNVLATNARALSLYERLGFRHEGVMRGHVLKDGEFRDVLVMGLLRAERNE